MEHDAQPPVSGHSAADLAGLEDRAGLHHLDAHPGVGLLDVDIDLVGGIARPVAQGVGEQLGEHPGRRRRLAGGKRGRQALKQIACPGGGGGLAGKALMQLLHVAPQYLKNMPPPPHRPYMGEAIFRAQALRRTSMSDQVGQPLERARALLESIALLETMAADREAKAEEILDRLSSPGMT
jgi:hypothetical protein